MRNLGKLLKRDNCRYSALVLKDLALNTMHYCISWFKSNCIYGSSGAWSLVGFFCLHLKPKMSAKTTPEMEPAICPSHDTLGSIGNNPHINPPIHTNTINITDNVALSRWITPVVIKKKENAYTHNDAPICEVWGEPISQSSRIDSICWRTQNINQRLGNSTIKRTDKTTIEVKLPRRCSRLPCKKGPKHWAQKTEVSWGLMLQLEISGPQGVKTDQCKTSKYWKNETSSKIKQSARIERFIKETWRGEEGLMGNDTN